MRGSWCRWWPYCTLRPSHATAGAGVGGGLTARCCRVAFAFKLATSFSRHSGSWRRRMRAQREPRQPNTRPDSCAARARRGSWQPAEMESTHSSAPPRKKHRTGPLRLTVPGWWLALVRRPRSTCVSGPLGTQREQQPTIARRQTATRRLQHTSVLRCYRCDCERRE